VALETLDPKRGRCLVGGVPLSAFMDNMIEIEHDEDAFTLNTGCDGHSARVASSNENGKATIYLQQTSPSNDFLSLLHAKDKANGTGVVPFLFADLSGRTVAEAAHAYVVWVRSLRKSPGYFNL
jgi:Protein of unknown function (DUF3277)